MGLKVSYYKNIILSLSRGYNKGIASNAKPLYLMAIFKGIEQGLIIGNILRFNKDLEQLYIDTCMEYEPDKKPAMFYKPFFHSKSEQYYTIKWKSGVAINKASHTPSAKYLRENVEFAALDDELWNLLQDTEIRNDFKNTIIKRFLS